MANKTWRARVVFFLPTFLSSASILCFEELSQPRQGPGLGATILHAAAWQFLKKKGAAAIGFCDLTMLGKTTKSVHYMAALSSFLSVSMATSWVLIHHMAG
jgi:hypothetical protein